MGALVGSIAGIGELVASAEHRGGGGGGGGGGELPPRPRPPQAPRGVAVPRTV